MRLHHALALALVLFPAPSIAQQQAASKPTAATAPRTMRAVRRTTPITIDGKLDDAAWATAEPSGEMVQAYSKPGVAAP